ncbi:MAG: C40 family peptidase [Paramuribaculum sp.]|nr:C40 family peptidase [Paramuribaculum sp.]
MKKFAAIATVVASVLTVTATVNSSSNLARASYIEATKNTLLVSVDTAALNAAQPIVEEEDNTDSIEEQIAQLTEYASTHLGKKYVWGAVGPKNFDCSGFTSHIFRSQGIELPRTSRMQYNIGEKVDVKDLRPGDLMFFSSPRTRRGTVGHVAMVYSVDPSTNSVTFIHASTKKGISFQKFPDNGYYSRTFIGAKRVIAPSA